MLYLRRMRDVQEYVLPGDLHLLFKRILCIDIGMGSQKTKHAVRGGVAGQFQGSLQFCRMDTAFSFGITMHRPQPIVRREMGLSKKGASPQSKHPMTAIAPPCIYIPPPTR
jgi:hypothetical protein